MHMEYYILISHICLKLLRFPMALLLFLNFDTTLGFCFSAFLTNPKPNCSDTICYDDLFFFFFKMLTDIHNGMTTCHSTNIWHMPHIMHQIIRVTSNSGI